MFGKSKPQSRIDSLIGATTRIEGNVLFSGGLRVDGAVRGNVQALPDQPATLVISEQARIEGDVHATHIVVNGTVVRTCARFRNARTPVELTGQRDVHYKSIEMHQGAIVEGRLVHQGAQDLKPVELKLAAGK